MHNLSGKTAIITGSGRGIGRGIALALAARGCNVTVNFMRKREAAEETVAAIEAVGQATGARAIVVKANMADEDDIQRMVAETVNVFGGVDIFVANAASGVLRPVMELERRHWDWSMDINARSLLIGAQATVPYMKQAGWGRILAVTSIGSRRVLPEYSAVGVSKAAIEAATRYLAVELAPFDIIANCISPGVVITGALDFFPSKAQIIEHATARTPARRLVTPEDVGELAAWLCSDAAALIVGQTIEIDGGYSLLA